MNVAAISNLYRNEGAGAMLRYAAERALYRVYETNDAFWFERNLSEPIAAVRPEIELDIDMDAGLKTILWIKSSGERWMLSENELRTAGAARHYFPSVMHKGTVIGYAKVATQRVYIDDYRREISLPERAAFIYDTYVCPPFRGRKIARRLISEIMLRLRGDGFAALGCHIPPWNTSSINAYTGAGFKCVRYARYRRLAGISWIEERKFQ